jgi:biotin operon repressor
VGNETSPAVTKAKPPAHTPKYRRLTRTDVALLLQLSKEGRTQVEIAQRLGCDQSAVSKWLKSLEDTTEVAKSYLRGSALRMAENIVKKGRAVDHVAALKGLSVLAEERSAGLTIQIGIKDSDVSIALSPGESPTLERRSAESLTIEAGSDKGSSVN